MERYKMIRRSLSIFLPLNSQSHYSGVTPTNKLTYIFPKISMHLHIYVHAIYIYTCVYKCVYIYIQCMCLFYTNQDYIHILFCTLLFSTGDLSILVHTQIHLILFHGYKVFYSTVSTYRNTCLLTDITNNAAIIFLAIVYLIIPR